MISVAPSARRAADSQCALAIATAAAPLTLLLANTDWFFTPEAYIDAWHYIGFFLNYSDPAFSPGAYKLARLPWILAGNVMYRVANPVAAAFLLHAVFLVGTNLLIFASVYTLLRRRDIAALATLFGGFYTFTHGSGGWDYHTTASGLFSLLTLWLVSADGAAPIMRAFGAGVSAALAVHSDILLVNFLPLWGVHWAALQRIRRGRLPSACEAARQLAAAVAGGVVITAILSGVNELAGRNPWFFRELAQIVLRYVTDTPNTPQANYWKPWSMYWFLSAQHLAFPAAIALAGSYWACRRREDQSPEARTARVLVGEALAMLVLWTAWQVAGQTALDWWYFAHPLNAPCILALAATFYLSAQSTVISSRALLAFAVILHVALSTNISDALDPVKALLAPAVVLLPTVMYAGSLSMSLARPAGVWMLLGLALANGSATFDSMSYAFSDACRLQADIHRAVVDISKRLRQEPNPFSHVRIWFSEGEHIQPLPGCSIDLSHIGYAVTATGFDYVAPAWPMSPPEDLGRGLLWDIAQDDRALVAITNDENNVSRLHQQVRQAGLEVRNDETAALRLRDTAVRFHILRLESTTQTPTGTPFDEILQSIPSDKLMTMAQLNVYGGSSRNVLEAIGKEDFRYSPTGPQDHVSFRFVPVPPGTNRWVRVSLGPSRAEASCRVFLQDQSFNVLGSSRCSRPISYFGLTDTTSRIRLYVSSERETQTAIPSSFEIALGGNDAGGISRPR